MRTGIVATTVALVLTAATLLSGQAVSPASEGKTAEQVYKNITALKGTPANELNQSMHLMKGALGMDCEYCHIEREWDKDDKAPKQVARTMILMTLDINRRQFGGRPVVTCYTCHNGRPVPMNMPVFPVFEPSKAAAPALPTVDQIVTRYVAALGGEQAIRKVTTRVITGNAVHPDWPRRNSADACGDGTLSEGAEPLRDNLPDGHVCRLTGLRRYEGVVAGSGGPGCRCDHTGHGACPARSGLP